MWSLSGLGGWGIVGVWLGACSVGWEIVGVELSVCMVVGVNVDGGVRV